MATNLKDPVMLRAAAEEFELDYKWLRRRVLKGEVRSEKIGKFVFVERADVKKIAPQGQFLREAMADRAAQLRKRKKEGGK